MALSNAGHDSHHDFVHDGTPPNHPEMIGFYHKRKPAMMISAAVFVLGKHHIKPEYETIKDPPIPLSLL